MSKNITARCYTVMKRDKDNSKSISLITKSIMCSDFFIIYNDLIKKNEICIYFIFIESPYARMNLFDHVTRKN